MRTTTRNLMRTLFMLCLVAFSTVAFAQGPPQKKGDEPKENKEKIQALKVTYITNKLQLTTKEAQAFWPVYNEFQAKNEQLRSQRKNVVKANGESQQLSDAELEKRIQQGFDMKQKELDLDKQYYAEFKKVLPIKKIAMLYQAERDFRKEVLKQAMDK